MPALPLILTLLMLESATAPVRNAPDSLQRIASRFDFEESSRMRLEMPLGFARSNPMGVDRFTSFGSMAPDGTLAHGGRFSLRFDLDGHSMAARSTPGLIPVRSGTEYEVSGWIRTDRLAAARASLAAWLIDGNGHPLPGSMITSASIESQDRWTRVSMIVPGRTVPGQDLVIECRVLQPADRIGDSLEQRSNDIDGTIWFDDLAVTQLPSVRIDDGHPTGIHRSPDAPRLHLRIEDQTTEPIDWTLDIEDTHGNTVDRHQGRMHHEELETWIVPSLPANGWYTARLVARTGDAEPIVRSDRIDLVLLPPAKPTTPVATIGLELPHAPTGTELDLARELGTGLLSIPAITDTGEGSLEDAATRRRLGRFLDSGGRLTCRIDHLPESWCRQHALDRNQVAEYLVLEEATWGPVVDRSMLPLGDAASSWRINLDPSHSDPRTLELATYTLQRRLRTLAPDAVVAPLQKDTSIDTVRLLDAWRNGVDRHVDPPWHTDARGRVRPTRSYPVLHALLHHLSERRFGGALEIDDSVMAWYLPPADRTTGDPGSAMLLLPGSIVDASVALGDGPVRVNDMSGNQRLVEPTNGTHTLVFDDRRTLVLEGVDDAMVRFHRDLQLDPPRVLARPRRHAHVLEITNPWDTTLEGVLHLRDGRRMQLSPNRIPLELAPGQTKRIGVDVVVTGPLAPGTTFIEGQLSRNGPDATKFPVRCPLDVGLDDVEIAFEDLPIDDGLRVVMKVANTGASSRSIEATIVGDGLPTGSPRRFDLEPGRTIVHHFDLVGTTAELADRSIHVRVAEVDATGRLSHAVEIAPKTPERLTGVPDAP